MPTTLPLKRATCPSAKKTNPPRQQEAFPSRSLNLPRRLRVINTSTRRHNLSPLITPSITRSPLIRSPTILTPIPTIGSPPRCPSCPFTHNRSPHRSSDHSSTPTSPGTSSIIKNQSRNWRMTPPSRRSIPTTIFPGFCDLYKSLLGGGFTVGIIVIFLIPRGFILLVSR